MDISDGICQECGAFFTKSGMVGGRKHLYCPGCVKKQNKIKHVGYRKTYYEKSKQDSKSYEKRRQYLKDKQHARRFSLSPEQYASMLESQNYVCAGCGRPEMEIDIRTGKPFSLSVDHCHKTGTIRALLCRSCNVALGSLNDDPARIQALLNYALEWHHLEEMEEKAI